MLSAWQHYSTIEPVRVLRMVLAGPVTLGHVLLLHEIQSPVVTGEPMTPGDLGNAVLILSGSVKSARGSMRSPSRQLAMKVWASMTGRLDMDREVKKFNDWFTAHCAAPVAWRKGSGAGKEAAAPWPLQLLARSMSELGMSRSDAEESSVLEVNQLIGAAIEARGDVEFKTDREQKVIDWLNQNEVKARN